MPSSPEQYGVRMLWARPIDAPTDIITIGEDGAAINKTPPKEK